MRKLKMKYKCPLCLTVFFLLSATLYSQPGITGKYIAYSADTSNIIIFRLLKDSMGYRCTYQLPLGGVANATAKDVRLRNDTLNIYLQQPIVTVSIIVAANDQLTNAEWKQNGQTEKLAIKPLLRPQTPQPPYPYLADSVEYDYKDKTVHLGATLTRPKAGNKKHPVAVLITGSGPEDRDETIFEHKSFAVIADYLTKNGIAVLRVDDRMTGKSKGDVMKATTADFAQDVLTSIRYLKTRPDIDTNKIGLIGHSEGGIIAAMTYNQWPHIAFVISLAGTGVPGSVILLQQQTDPLKGAVSKAAFDAYYQLQQEKFAAFEKYYSNDSLAIATLATGFDKWKQQYPDSILIPLNAKVATGTQYAQQIKMQVAIPWLKYFTHADPADYYKNVQCPVLALNGEKDTQVKAIQNTTAIKAALQKGGNQNITIKIFPELNHLFQHSKSGELKEYPLIEETISTDVLLEMRTWLRKIQIIK